MAAVAALDLETPLERVALAGDRVRDNEAVELEVFPLPVLRLDHYLFNQLVILGPLA
jgi:hypothetical protein